MRIPILKNTKHPIMGENDQEKAIAAPAVALRCACLDAPASSNYYLTQVKEEESENEVKEEEVGIKSEDDDSCDGSFESHQCKNRIRGNSHDLGRTWSNIDGIIELGLSLRKEVKVEPCDHPVNGNRSPPTDEIVEETHQMRHYEGFGPAVPGYNCEDVDDVKPLLNSPSDPLNSFLKAHSESSMRPKPIERKRNLISKRKLNWLFNCSDKMYHCNQCGYKAKYAQTMEYHRATHTGEKPYECKHCDYKAGHPTTLRRHMRRHTGEKPHACKHCDYRAAQPTALLNHMRCMHTGEKPYSCDSCSFRAHDQGSLASHKLSHLLPDEKPFECDICGVKMTRRTHLLRHARSKHPGENVCLDRRISTTTKNQSFAMRHSRSKKLPKLFKRSKAFEEMFGSSSESFSSLSSDDEMNSLITKKCQQPSLDDQEYRPDRCVTLPSASIISNRPRRSIIAPKKLDL